MHSQVWDKITSGMDHKTGYSEKILGVGYTLGSDLLWETNILDWKTKGHEQ